jgi:sugar phosphate isomerase/epimerase
VFIAASSRCFSDCRFDDACRAIADLQYDKIDVWLDEKSKHLKPSEVAADPDAFAQRMRDASRLAPVAFTFAHDTTPEVLKGVCLAAKAIRVTQVTVPAAEIGTPFNSEIDRLRKFITIANECGVRLAIHTKTGHLTEDPHTAVELCQSVRGLGIALDPSYYICGPHRNESFDQVYPYVFHTFLRDTLPNQLQVQVGLGEVDYAKIITSLKREDYRRSLTVDFDPALLPDPSMRPLEMRKLRLLLETLL